MIDHFNLPVADVEKSFLLYQRILKPFDIVFLLQDQDAYGFGIDYWQFGLYQCDQKINPLHFAIKARNRAVVEAFYQLAIDNGAKDNGKPGLREHFGLNYYAAFILDFDGHNVEAVCRNNN